MTKKNLKFDKKTLLKNLPYLLAAFAVLGVALFGSLNKNSNSSGSLSMDSLANNDFSVVSTDQLSEFYMVASVANSVNLASSETVASNYVTVSVMRNAGQNASDRLEHRVIIDTSNLARCGVNIHTVSDGETMDSIANKYKVSTDQIRWSNGLKTASVAPGNTLYVPGTSGIVYTVKSGDTVDSLASKYGSNAEEIVACNDLETTQTLAVGSKIVLPDGSLPETERPEYVAPVVHTYTPVYTYTYSGSGNSRENLRVIATGFYVASPGNPGVAGQCTWYAWYMRATDPRSLGVLPGGVLGNANAWARTLGNMGYRVDHTPEAGAVFQTAGGSYYGHVGYVTAVNGDGSITIREMNFGIPYRVTESEIPANLVGNFNYIH